MSEKCVNALKKLGSAIVDQPFLGSMFIADAAILSFHKPPFIFSVVMLGALVGMSMYYGQKLALFQSDAKQE